MNIIGDIAGNYLTFLALIKKMPDDEVISVGDMVDRGPRSKEVLEWFMKNGQALLGNHEQMMLNAIKRTEPEFLRSWIGTGGLPTIQSFGLPQEKVSQIPKNIVSWLEQLPLYLQSHGAFISHAPKDPDITLPIDEDDPDYKEIVQRFL